MKVKIFSFITALSIGFSSLIFPFYSVSAFAQQAVIPWPYIFRFIAESLGAYAISKGADYAVDQLTGSGRKMTDDEYNATSKDWDACVSYMKSHGCTDSDIENLQAQIQGGDLDLSSKVGQSMQNYFAQKGANIDGAWNDFIEQNANIVDGVSYCPHEWDLESVKSWLNGLKYSEANIDYCKSSGINLDDIKPDNKVASNFVGNIPCVCSPITTGWGKINTVGYYKYLNGSYHFYYMGDVSANMLGFYIGYNPQDDENPTVIYADSATIDDMKKRGVQGNFSRVYGENGFIDTMPINGKIPSCISCNGGNIPHYYDNTIDNDDSSKNTYNNTPASIDWSKIFDHDDDKNPTFKKIDGYTPPEPKIKEDGSNYDEVIKQLKESNSKLAKILGWLEDFDYDNNGKIKDRRLSPIEPNTPLFNFKLSEKFPFSLPWDMLAILSILKAAPVAPKYEFPIMLPDETGKVKPIKLSDNRIGVIQGDKIVLDFTSQDWQDMAKILRWGELVLFVCGLCVVFWKYGK